MNDTNNSFNTELTHLLNRMSMENESDTPDYILAQYITDCLAAYNSAVNCTARHHNQSYTKSKVVAKNAEQFFNGGDY